MVEENTLVGLDTDRDCDSGYSLSEICLCFLKIQTIPCIVCGEDLY